MALWFYALTLFVSAFLLFLVQPMIGKMILPRLGGTPQVWNTCMVFFQMVLLAGYAYTHTVSSRLQLRKQLLIHGLVLLVPVLVLLGAAALSGDHNPFSIQGWVPPPGANPIPSTLMLLAMVVGIPFFVVATSAPLLQKWFASTGHPAAKDPYFLYGASNLGSMLALLCYPAIVEPLLLLNTQAWVWAVGYILLAVLILGCAVMVWRAPEQLQLAGAEVEPPPGEMLVPPVEPNPSTAVQATPPKGAARLTGKKKGVKLAPAKETAPAPVVAAPPRVDTLTWSRRLRWVGLAAAPSSLMLGVTTYISTDLSPIPLIWIVPLALYLLSFILVFMRWPLHWLGLPHQAVLFIHPVLVLCMAYNYFRGGFNPVWSTVVAMCGFLTTALVCHGELAKDRPSTKHLTEFYLWMSVGGMVGGMFNGLLAPVLFWGVVEFPLAIILGCLLRPGEKKTGWTEDSFFFVFANARDWLVERGNEVAKSFKRPASSSPFLLSIPLDFLLPVILGLFFYYVKTRSHSEWGWVLGQAEDADEIRKNPLVGLWTSFGFSLKTAMYLHPFTFYGLVYGVPMLLCFLMATRPLRLGLGVAALFLANQSIETRFDQDVIVHADRSYFGVLRVRERTRVNAETQEVVSRYTSLLHGTTHHGLNFQDPPEYRRLATTYYHQLGPAGLVMDKYNWFQNRQPPPSFPAPPNDPRTSLEKQESKAYLSEITEYVLKVTDFHVKNIQNNSSDARLPASLVGMGALSGLTNMPVNQLVDLWSEPPFATIGLGTGTMAAYGRPYQHVHFYEIDNQVRRMSLPLDDSTPFFNYLQGAKKRGSLVQVRMGDARLRMAFNYEPFDEEKERESKSIGGGPDNFYHMMVVDAFSSDAIPIHLITRQAIEMYFKKLVPEGVLCVHTSNRHVDLVPVVADVARSIQLPDPITGEKRPLVSRVANDKAPFPYHVYAAWGRDRPHFNSEWVMVARSDKILDQLKTPVGYEESVWRQYRAEGYDAVIIRDRISLNYWSDPERRSTGRFAWTDDYSNVLGVFRWR